MCETTSSGYELPVDRSQLKDPKNPCQEAVPLKHRHFFTANGEFGSRDA